MSKRDEYVAKAKEQLDELNQSIDTLEQRMADAKDDAKTRYAAEMKKLREQSRAATAKLEELKLATESQWDKLVSEAEKLRDALKHSYNYFKSQL